MPLDIYKKNPIRVRSKEHIIPDFLGGKLKSIHLIDKSTNDGFGSGIDAALSTALHSLRVIMDARKATNPSEPPRKLSKVKAADGGAYDLEAGGILRPRQQRLTVSRSANVLSVRGVVPDMGLLRRQLRRPADDAGMSIDVLMEKLAATAQIVKGPQPPLTLSVELWDAKPYRATAKIACNLLAHHTPGLFLSAAFDGIRSFVLHGTTQPTPLVQAVTMDIRESGLGRLDHIVVVQAHPSGEVTGLVVYFGVLGFVVNLGTIPGIDAFRHSYRVDQLGRTDRLDDCRDAELVIPSFAEAAARTYEEYHAVACAQVELLSHEVEQVQLQLWIKRVVREHCARLKRKIPDGGEPTAEDVREFVVGLKEEIVEGIRPRLEAAAHARRREAARSRGLPLFDDDDGNS